MVTFIKVTERMESSKGKVGRNELLVWLSHLKVTSIKVKKKDSEPTSEETGAHTPENSKETKSTGKEPTHERMSVNTQGNGTTTKSRGREFSFMRMGGNTRVSLKVIINTGKEVLNDLMELFLKGYGFMGNNTVKGCWFMKGRRGRVSGRKEFY